MIAHALPGSSMSALMWNSIGIVVVLACVGITVCWLYLLARGTVFLVGFALSFVA